MKKLKNKLSIILLILFLGLGFSCEINDANVREIQLTSPMGFNIGSNISELKQTLGFAENYRINIVKFVENHKFNGAFIDYVDNNGAKTNIVIVRGKVKYESNKLQTSNFSNLRKYSSAKRWKIYCGGCEKCRVGGTLDLEDNLIFQCESSCCTLTVEIMDEIE